MVDAVPESESEPVIMVRGNCPMNLYNDFFEPLE